MNGDAKRQDHLAPYNLFVQVNWFGISLLWDGL